MPVPDNVPSPPTILQSLSARLLALTIVFVLLAVVMIFLPSIGRFRQAWLTERLDSAAVVTSAIAGGADQRKMLERVGLIGIQTPAAPGGEIIGTMPSPDILYDFDRVTLLDDIGEALRTLTTEQEAAILVIGRPSLGGPPIAVTINESSLRSQLMLFSKRVLNISVYVSLMAGALLYLTLQWLMVQPMRRLTASMIAFRKAPENPDRIIRPGARPDEIGIAERALAEMQSELRAALTQKAHLAALGTAVGKIHHDLRGILSSAMLVSERLEASHDPEVRRLTPTVVNALERAVFLCTQTLRYAREGPPQVSPADVPLSLLIDEVARPFMLGGAADPTIGNLVAPDLHVRADRELLFRVLTNLMRNSLEAGAQTVRFHGVAEDGVAAVLIEDDGPGLPPKAQANLFVPFTGSARAGGTGLGLAIARELMAAQGGDITLERTGPDGTAFRLLLPCPEQRSGRVRAAAARPETMLAKEQPTGAPAVRPRG